MYLCQEQRDASVITAAIKNSASPPEIQDLEEDMAMTRFVADEKEKAEFRNAWHPSGVTWVIQNCGEVKRAMK